MSSALSKRASIVSIDSILTDTHDGSFSASETPSVAESRVKDAMPSLVIQPGGGKTHGGSYTGPDGPFIRHEKYFFSDGNVTFLVRGHGIGYGGVHTRLINWVVG
jgi:hypothetical protein